MPIEHKHIARHIENTQQIAKSICKGTEQKANNAVIMVWPPPSFWACQKEN